MEITNAKFGEGDATYKAVGGATGLRDLVEKFYDVMEVLPEAKHILSMHPRNLKVSRDKLYCFLSGWMGGPRLFADKYGPIAIPRAHAHLVVNEAERDAWLACMKQALEELDYDEDIKEYLMMQLRVPAERIRLVAKK